VPDLLPRALARGRASGGDEGLMVRLATNVSDPVGDLLTRIRNANLAQKDDLVVPASKMSEAIVKILTTEGFVEGYAPEGEGIERVIRVPLKYGPRPRGALP